MSHEFQPPIAPPLTGETGHRDRLSSAQQPNARIAREEDVPALLAMMTAFCQLEQTPWDANAKERALRRLLKDPSLGLVALVETIAGPAGYFVLSWGYDLEWDGRDAFLTELFLLPEARGKAIGGVALAMAEALARTHDARAIHLMVRVENTVAHRLYVQNGYASPARIFLSKQL
jgi:GNAT superfamily N-acetyltransferase